MLGLLRHSAATNIVCTAVTWDLMTKSTLRGGSHVVALAAKHRLAVHPGDDLAMHQGWYLHYEPGSEANIP